MGPAPAPSLPRQRGHGAARRMRDGKSNHEEISPSEKKKGGGIPI